MAGQKKKPQPAARKCLSACTICCWYLLSRKSRVVFSYLHSFTVTVFSSDPQLRFSWERPELSRLRELQRGARGDGAAPGRAGAAGLAFPMPTLFPPRHRVLPAQQTLLSSPKGLWDLVLLQAQSQLQPVLPNTLIFIFFLNASPPWLIL